jgi:hypothetical protein
MGTRVPPRLDVLVEANSENAKRAAGRPQDIADVKALGDD